MDRLPRTQQFCFDAPSQLHSITSGARLPDSSLKRSSSSYDKPAPNVQFDVHSSTPSYDSVPRLHDSNTVSRISTFDYPDPLFLARKIARKETTESQETIPTPLSIDPKYGLRFASLNVNGCRVESKRILVDMFLLSYGVHVAVLQEVNLDCQRVDTPNFRWYLGAPSNSRKRGLAILIRPGLPLKVKESRNYGSNVQRVDVVYQV